MNGWRTVAIRSKSSLEVEDRLLRIETDGRIRKIPLDQLGHLLMDTGAVTLPASVLSVLAEEHVRVLLCDARHVPGCEVIPVGRHHEAAGSVMDQAAWSSENRNRVWKCIVELKLRNQKRLLDYTGRTPPPKFQEYLLSVKPGDTTNREALAAKLYLHTLFGNDFRRHTRDPVNAKLNYGYTILCSAFSRVLAMHGYHTGLGIHHYSRDNPVNLSCDLMEPFRPMVDHLVYNMEEGDLDWEKKKRFISMMNDRCWLEGRGSTVEETVEIFTLKTLAAVKKGEERIPEVRFV